MLSRVRPTFLALDPVPKALSALAIHENEQILVILLCYLLVDRGAGLCIRDATVCRAHLEDDHAREFSNLYTVEVSPAGLVGNRLSQSWARPTKFVAKQRLEVETLKEIAGSRDIKLSHACLRSAHSDLVIRCYDETLCPTLHIFMHKYQANLLRQSPAAWHAKAN